MVLDEPPEMLGGLLAPRPYRRQLVMRCKKHWLGYGVRKYENGSRSSRLLPCSMSMCKKGVRQTQRGVVNLYPNP
jgi:hypothetical protein